MKENSIREISIMASEASNFLWEVLHVHYCEDEEDDEMEFDMEMFKKFLCAY